MNKFSLNFRYISDNPGSFYIKQGYCEFSQNYNTIESKETSPGLICSRDGSNITVHSPYYPLREARKIVDKFLSEKDCIVVLGIGLGYYLLELCSKYPNKQIFIIEPDKNLFSIFCHHIDLEKLGNCTFFVGLKDYEIMNIVKIKKDDFDIFEVPSLTKINHCYFESVKKKIRQEPFFDLGNNWKYKKFTSPQVKVVMIDSGYALSKECISSITNLGHDLKYVYINKEEYDYQAFFKNILTLIGEFRPDFFLTINHLGFDLDGRLTELLTSMELPFVSWYVDSPTVVLSSYQQNKSPFCNIFVWDKDYIKDLKDLGYEHVDYLPLATMSSFFRPLQLQSQYRISFVGSSMVFSVHKNMRSFIHKPELIEAFYKVAYHFSESESRNVHDVIDMLQKQGYQINFQTNQQKEDFLAGVIWRATQIYRLKGLLKLAEFYPSVFGDPNWDNLLDNRFQINREVLYYENLPEIYNKSKINFNMTSKQMRNAVNQRVFDVPACGKFLLTDYKEQLEEIFDVGKDIICFREIDEIPELVKFYLKEERLRNSIALSGRNKILTNNTYEHRISKMIDVMKKRYRRL